MIGLDVCKAVMDGYRNGMFSDWESCKDGHRMTLGDIATLLHSPNGTFHVDLGRGWMPVASIEWHSGIHIRIPGGEIIIDKEDS